MKFKSLQHKAKNLVGLIAAAIILLFANSCNALHEDLQPCPRGLRLRFVYDYNMLFANAFPSQVHCLTLLVYDESGNYVTTVTETNRDLLSNENWRMTLDLPAGKYILIAYGGMACENASFVFDPEPGRGVNMTQVDVDMKPEFITSPENNPLHDLFYGRLEVEVPETGTDYTEETVEMMKDTNNFRILLANENGQPIDTDDFDFTITDNNTEFNYLNDIISTDNVTYRPWAKGNGKYGLLPDSDEQASVAWAEISTSRLMYESDAFLLVTRKEDGKRVLRIPLIEVLLLLKSEHFASMKSQEFLDRESFWNLTFFLTGSGIWGGVEIIVNDWIVRINNISVS